jgi:hypothetical protein
MAASSRAFTQLLEVLDKLEIPYAVGGSVASSAHGIPRTTLDVDLVVDLKPDQIDDFVQHLGSEFYADGAQIRRAFAQGRAANLIHMVSAWKFDLFPLQADEYSQTGFGRRTFREIKPDGIETIECAVISAEDIVLRKLEWYRAGNEVSERQWNDLRGISKAAGRHLDINYLRKWAGTLKVEDLLERLLTEAGLS